MLVTAPSETTETPDGRISQRLFELETYRLKAQHSCRFAATHAYNTLVTQRIAGLREKAIPGTQTLGEFMQRRLSPAMATAQRLASLAERISRASALLRTRVDIATEAQNQ